MSADAWKGSPLIGEVVKLDRKFPLVQLESGERIRCEHSAKVKKGAKLRACIGDIVDVALPDDHEFGVIEGIHDRRTSFVRKDPTERAVPQVLAANFDRVIVVQPLNGLNLKRLERELVLAHETGAKVSVVLTKADLMDDDAQASEAAGKVREFAGDDVDVLVMAKDDDAQVNEVRNLVPQGTTAILIGRSGVGKSTMVNILCGDDAQATSEVRSRDGKGRHTTVSREIIQLPLVDGIGGGRLVDMPGVRGLGLWDADEGIGAAFSDIEELAARCRFRDCRHMAEPGCAVRAAVDDGTLSSARLESYLGLQQELAKNARRREQSSWKNR